MAGTASIGSFQPVTSHRVCSLRRPHASAGTGRRKPAPKSGPPNPMGGVVPFEGEVTDN